MIPDSLRNGDQTYFHGEALFGVPEFGSSVVGELQYVGSFTNNTGCQPYTAPSSWAQTSVIALVDRGDCHFTQKVFNAQRAGAQAVVIADNEKMCGRDPECGQCDTCLSDAPPQCACALPFMADDGGGVDVDIASFIIAQYDANRFKACLSGSTYVYQGLAQKVYAK